MVLNREENNPVWTINNCLFDEKQAFIWFFKRINCISSDLIELYKSKSINCC